MPNCVSVTCAISLSFVATCHCAQETIDQDPVLGGTEDTDDEFTAVVKIKSGVGGCTGTLIDCTHVLTAAHCVCYCSRGATDSCGCAPMATVTVVARNQDDQTIQGSVNVHPAFFQHRADDAITGGCGSKVYDSAADIALISLSSPAVYPAKKLGRASSDPRVHAQVTIVGFGETSCSSDSSQYAAPPVRRFANNEVAALEGYEILIDETPGDNKASPGHGDSGGPLIDRTMGDLIVGVASRGGCGKNARYTNVHAYSMWLTSAIGECSGKAWCCKASRCVDLASNPEHCGFCGVRCAANERCENRVCKPRPPSCTDSVKNGLETDIDCGGRSCPSCLNGARCAAPKDCQSGFCLNDICVPSAATALASNLNSPWDIAVDGRHVYWVENSRPGALRRVSKTGGTVETLAQALSEPTAVVVDAEYAYILERNGGANGCISRVPIRGGSVQTVVCGLTGAANHLVQDADRLYVADYIDGVGGVLKSVAKSADAAAQIIVRGHGLSGLNPPIAVDASYAYFRNDLNEIWRTSKSGVSPELLGAGRPESFAIFGGELYYPDMNAPSRIVAAMPTTGGFATTLMEGLVAPADVAVDSTYVYWIETSVDGTVGRVPVAGGPAKIYSRQANTIGIEVDEQFVYWATNVYTGKGAVMRVAK